MRAVPEDLTFHQDVAIIRVERRGLLRMLCLLYLERTLLLRTMFLSSQIRFSSLMPRSVLVSLLTGKGQNSSSVTDAPGFRTR